MQLVLLSAFCLLAVLGLCRMVLRYDRFDREPLALLFAAPLIGAWLGWACVFPQMPTEALLRACFCEFCDRNTALGLSTGLAAALSESVAKIAGVLLCMLVARRTFNDPLDGLIYGSLVGAGFGAGETLGRDGEYAGIPVFALAAIEIVMHMFFGGILGTAFGLRFTRIRWVRRGWVGVLLGLTIATLILHFWWDLLAEPRLIGPSDGTRRKLAAMTAVVTALLYFGLVPFGSLMSKQRFEPESATLPMGAWLLRRLRLFPPNEATDSNSKRTE